MSQTRNSAKSRKVQSSFNFPNNSSSFFSFHGPIPIHVIVPGSTWVWPASLISSHGIPADFASLNCSSNSASPSTFSTIFFCPSCSHSFAISGNFFRTMLYELTDACEHCPPIFPFPSFRSERMIIVCLYISSSFVSLFFYPFLLSFRTFTNSVTFINSHVYNRLSWSA